MARGKSAQAQQRRRHRHLVLVDKGEQFFAGAGFDDAVSGENQRPLRLVDELQCTFEVSRYRLMLRPISGTTHRTVVPDELDLRLLRVLGDIDQHRPGTTAARNEKSLAQRG